MTDPANEASSSILVCPLSEFPENGRKMIRLDGREIVVFRTQERFFALDARCYHTGGPLEHGDIEDIAGRSCVVCPWHKYKICLDTGESLYQQIDPKNLQKPPEWKSKGVKQRVHQVAVLEGVIYVQLSDTNEKRESDFYYSEQYKQMMGR